MRYKVKIPDINLIFEAEEGSNLFVQLVLHKVFPSDGSFCGGTRDCGRCAILVDGKKVLSCKTFIDSDITVFFVDKPPKAENAFSEPNVNLVRRKRMLRVDRGNFYSGGKIGVAVDLGTTTIHFAFLELPSGYADIPEKDSLKGYSPLKKLGNLGETDIHEKFYPEYLDERISAGIKVDLEREESEEAIIEAANSVKGDEFFSRMYSIFNKVKILKISSVINHQIAFGDDIMSRISEALQSSETKETLRSLVSSSISYEIKTFLLEFDLYEVDFVVISGNVAMITLFLGEDTRSISQYPYFSDFLTVDPKTPHEIGLEIYNPIKRRAKVYRLLNDSFDEVETSGDYLNHKHIIHFVPGISPFVGGDFVSGLTLLPKPQKGKHSILIDMGTNTEIGIFTESLCVVGSAPAGPCFEGGNISSGMRSAPGAIYKYRINEKGIGEIKFIESGKSGETESIPRGICGSGLIDIIAELRRTGVIDEKGLLKNGEKDYRVTGEISLTQKDIREFQLAKSAIRTGIDILTERAELTGQEIETIYVSGGFSEAISIASLVNSGLIPKEFSNRCVTLGNTSLYGAIAFFLSGKRIPNKIIRNAEQINLVAEPQFQSKFIENTQFI